MQKIYKKGRRKEYSVVEKLKRLGYDIAQRTAGSHGVFDVIGICLRRKEIVLIQVKPEGFNAEKILKDNKELNGDFKVKFEVW